MLGLGAISETPIATALGITIPVAGTCLGVAALNGSPRTHASTAGHCAGASALFGYTRAFGGAFDLRNQSFDFSVNVLQALLWQYNEAPNLTVLLQAKQDWYDTNQKEFWQKWVNDVFDLRTANDFGCAVWSYILRIPLAIEWQHAAGPAWGFGPYTSGGPPTQGNMNFERGNFQSIKGLPLPLTLEQKRIVLQLRYFQLFTHGAIPQINAFFKRLFGHFGPVYVVDHLDMTMTYHFGFVMPKQLLFLFNYYKLLPQPSGVAVDFTYL